jgi:hypothetical protein
MERYDSIPIIQTTPTVQYPKVIRYRASTRYPDIPLSENDVLLYTIRGDRLDNLAYQFYGDPTLWWILSIANPDLPNDSLYPTLGFQLRIPGNFRAILNDFDQLNN